MTRHPDYKAYRDGEFVASFKYPEDAAAFVSTDCANEVRFRHRTTVWHASKESFPASESFDRAGALMHERAHAKVENYK